jgi:hypothetical protein
VGLERVGQGKHYFDDKRKLYRNTAVHLVESPGECAQTPERAHHRTISLGIALCLGQEDCGLKRKA